ncbi:MAG: YwmB family TATA-box binding protein [Bacillota bacterium]
MKKTLLAIIFLSSFFSLYFNAPVPTAGVKSPVEDVLCQSFEASGAEFHRVKVQAWALVNTSFLQPKELEALAYQAAKALGDEKRLNSSLEQAKHFTGVTLEGEVGAGTYVQIVAQTLENLPEAVRGGNETFLLINLAHSRDMYALPWWQEQVRTAFRQFGGEPHVLVAITGAFPGYLSQRESAAQVKKVLQAAQAKWVEGMTEGNLISVSGYTNSIQNYLVIGGRRVNINVALRYHDTDDRTYLDIGSPLLDGEY